ncbi:hypothetical protein [Lichenifustis flavocetrariae]|uniref:Uncharacterized protein n=1 Tax=Lichenifustis flavocetrariae TaxID=2949735 RepID=A0AA42CN34_9HYPH|nr:hypothetical protein [Lichenifustis flavocetrariae]MCW6508975.1 hypothetical protein [Lichenifustis flavocetrariae]
MASHLYEVGDVVSLNFHEGQFFSKLNPFTVEAQMPHLGTDLQYRIKSKSEAYRRVVAEHQLSSFGSQPGTMPIILMGTSPAGPAGACDDDLSAAGRP